MHRGAYRDIAQRQAIAGLDRRRGTGLQHVASLYTLGAMMKRRHRLQTTAGQYARSGWVVFDALNRGCNTVLVTLEVDNPVVLFVTTTNVPGGDTAIVVPATVPGLRFQQGL